MKLGTRSCLFALLFGATLLACDGGNGSQSGADGGPDGVTDASDNADAAAPGDWSNLISGDWEMPAGSEGYKCVRLTMTEDTYITGFKSLGPVGTHHTVLTAGSVSGPDGISDCNAGTNAESMIFGSGVGDIEFNFPEGVGVKIAAGQQLLLNLHLFNLSDAPIADTSGTFARLVSAADVVNEAEGVLMGKVIGLTVVPGVSDQVGQCTIEQSVTLLTVAPHMHQLGSHMKVVAKAAAGDQILHDEAYDFFDQKLYVLPEPLQLEQGDKIEVTCTYDNTTGSTVNFGDSSTAEMCFAGMYRYPKRTNSGGQIGCIF